MTRRRRRIPGRPRRACSASVAISSGQMVRRSRRRTRPPGASRRSPTKPREIEQRPARVRERDSRSLTRQRSIEVGALVRSNARARRYLRPRGIVTSGDASIEPFEAPQGGRRPVRDEGAGSCRRGRRPASGDSHDGGRPAIRYTSTSTLSMRPARSRPCEHQSGAAQLAAPARAENVPC